MATMWEGLDAEADLNIEAGLNHFSIVDGLKTAASPIVRAFLEGG
jgi:hypothetical protein